MQQEDEFVTSFNKVLAECLCPLYVVRKDKDFRDFFQIDEHLDAPRQPAVVPAGEPQYISFMSMANKKLKEMQNK